MTLVPLYDEPANSGVGQAEGFQVTEDPEAPSDLPTFAQTVGAAARLENSVVSALSSNALRVNPNPVDPDLNVWDEIKGTRYEQYYDRFAYVVNRPHLRALMADIDRETEDRRTISVAGGTGILATVGASIFDLPTLIPGGVIYRGVKAGQAALRAGVSTGAAAAGSTAVQEALLHGTQQTRTAEETGIAIGGSFILGGLLGAGVAGAMSRAEFNRLAQAVEKDVAQLMKNADEHGDPTKMTIAGTTARDPGEEIVQEMQNIPPAGLEAVKRAVEGNHADMDIYGAGKWLAKPTKWLNPILRGLTSPSVAYRELLTQLIENPLYLNKNFAGQASDPAVETLMKEFTRGAMADSIGTNHVIYKQMKKAGINMPYNEFSARIGRALRNNDIDHEGNEFVSQAAKNWRAKLFNPLKERAIEAGLLPKDVDVDTALSYFTRVYNTRKIEARQTEFKTIVRDWANFAVDREFERLTKQNAKAVSNIQSEIDELQIQRLRRTEDIRRSQQLDDMTQGPDSASIWEAVRMVQNKERPPQPQTLTQFLHKQGGLVDEDGALRTVGITPQGRPGFVRKALGTNQQRRGLTIDEAIDQAYRQGFFETKPSRLEFLETLSDDFARRRRVVTANDREAAARADVYDQVVASLQKLGIDIDQPRFQVSSDLRRLADDVLATLNHQTDLRVAALRSRLTKVQQDFDELKASQFDMGTNREKYIDDIVESVFNKITGREVEELPKGLSVTTRGPLKERTFDIQDRLIEEFLVDDVEEVGTRYARVMSADIELTRKFGSADMKQAIEAVRADYNRLREAAQADADLAGDPDKLGKVMQRLKNRETADIDDLKAMRDLVRGQFQERVNNNNWARVTRALQVWNYLRAMGGVVASSFVDIFRHTMVHGFGPVFMRGLPALITNMKAVRLSVQEARIAGAVTERLTNTRIMTQAEILDPYNAASPFERWMTNLSTGFSKLNGMVYWNDFQKSFASILTQDRILRNLENWDKLPAKEAAYMRYLGFNDDMARRVLDQYNAAAAADRNLAGNIDGLRVPGTELWTDLEARSLYRAALNKDVDSIIVTRGYGDIPVFANTPTGRLLLQFRSFALASNQRILMRGVQEGHAGVYLGAMSSIMTGMLIYAFKAIESGRELSDNPGTWLSEGIDRSGLFTLFFEMNNAFEKIGGPGVYRGLSALYPDADQRPPASRFAARTMASGFLGPSVGLLEEMGQVLSIPFQEDMKKSDVSSAFRVAPGRTLPLFRSFLDYKVIPYLQEELVDQ